jgi:hypothetical protein
VNTSCCQFKPDMFHWTGQNYTLFYMSMMSYSYMHACKKVKIKKKIFYWYLDKHVDHRFVIPNYTRCLFVGDPDDWGTDRGNHRYHQQRSNLRVLISSISWYIRQTYLYFCAGIFHMVHRGFPPYLRWPKLGPIPIVK